MLQIPDHRRNPHNAVESLLGGYENGEADWSDCDNILQWIISSCNKKGMSCAQTEKKMRSIMKKARALVSEIKEAGNCEIEVEK